MSVREPDIRSDPRSDAPWPNGLEMGRLTAIGLIVAGLGWALLIGEATVADVLPGRSARAALSLHLDLLEIARCMIGSGFALAIVGALQSGFGALNRFFAAVLLRSSQRAASVTPAPVMPPPPAAPRERRPYRKLADGTVEVETILGTRRFATMGEAADFI